MGTKFHARKLWPKFGLSSPTKPWAIGMWHTAVDKNKQFSITNKVNSTDMRNEIQSELKTMYA